MIHKGTNILLLPEILEQISLNSGQKTVFIGRVHLLHSPRQAEAGKLSIGFLRRPDGKKANGIPADIGTLGGRAYL